jgi:RNA recognition motif-containing protein
MGLTEGQLQEERKQLDREWEKLRAERAAFEAERKESGVEYKMFIGNLDETTVEEEISELFSPYGDLKEIVMLTGRDGKSKRSCFVKFFSKSAAEAALNDLNGKHTDKDSPSQLVVRYARDKVSAPAMSAAAPSMSSNPYAQYNQPYMGSVYSNGYGGMAAAYGNPVSVPSGPPMGAGAIGGAPGVAPSFGRGPSGANLYVNNLSKHASEKDVTKMFADFGHVVSVKLFNDNGYGFVSYDNVASAQNAIQYLNGLAMGDGSRRLEVSVKKDKGSGGGAGGGGSRFSPY